MFRLQENTPEIYTKQSRDFQTFCRIYDVINNAIRFNATSAGNLLDPLKTSDRMLPLLATRVGFFPKIDYDTNALRQVISSFPYIVKYKGSKQGIEMALNVILKIENNYQDSIVNIDTQNSIVNIYTKTKIQGEDLLRDVLSYILPIGYDLTVNTYVEKDLSNSPSQLGFGQDSVITTEPLNTNVSIVINQDNGNSNNENQRPIGSYTTTLVVGENNIQREI